MPINKKINAGTMLGYLLGCAAALTLVAALWHGVIGALDVPEVHVSHASGECVRVRDFKAEQDGRAPRWSCAQLPPRYDRVWVP